MREPLFTSPKDALPVMRELLASGASFPIRVTGNSMVPFLHHGKETVTVAPVTRPLRKGDIVFYTRGTKNTVHAEGKPGEGPAVESEPILILHRVYRLTDYGFIALGDAQMKKEPVSTSQVLGVVTEVRKSGKCYSEDRIFHRFLVTLWRWLYPLRPHLMRFFRTGT